MIKATGCTLDVMMGHADKGQSGFWTKDRKEYGNPRIFPEFEKGMGNVERLAGFPDMPFSFMIDSQEKLAAGCRRRPLSANWRRGRNV